MFIEDGKRRFVDITDSVPVKLGCKPIFLDFTVILVAR